MLPADAAGGAAARRADACHLARWCLEGDPLLRPTLDDIVAHRLLASYGGVGPPREKLDTSLRSALDGAPLPPLLARSSSRTRYHFFVSHFQVE